MTHPVLYLLIGYPGAGKTTTARGIHELTDAEHIWADQERQQMFGTPTHTQEESDKLYTTLNARTTSLLQAGKSVIFDTNFSFRRDRDHLRSIARDCGADARVLWVRVDTALARERATHSNHANKNGYDNPMDEATFNKIVSHLEPPTEDEHAIILDGTRITTEYLQNMLGL